MSEFASEPSWMPHAYDPAGDRVQFLRFPAEAIAGPTFLADHKPAQARDEAWLPASEVKAMAVEAVPVHFIFHTAFCRSTLLVRAIGATGLATGLSEPGILNSLALAGSRALPLLGPCLALLARPHGSERSVVIKPSNIANALIPHIMAACPGSRAVLMSNGLADFCGSVHRKGMMGRRWTRRLYLHVQSYAPIDLGMDERSTFELTDMQVAGLAWFVQQTWFARMLACPSAERMRTLDGDDFNAQRARTLCLVTDLFGLPLAHDSAVAIAERPLFASHAKLGGDYEPQIARQMEGARSEIVDQEIAMVAAWIGQIEASAGLSLPVSRPLE